MRGVDHQWVAAISVPRYKPVPAAFSLGFQDQQSVWRAPCRGCNKSRRADVQLKVTRGAIRQRHWASMRRMMRAISWYQCAGMRDVPACIYKRVPEFMIFIQINAEMHYNLWARCVIVLNKDVKHFARST